MLRQVFIVLNDKLAYQRSYAKGLDVDLFSTVYQKVKKVALSKFGPEAGTYEFFEYKLSFIINENAMINPVIMIITGIYTSFLFIFTHLFFGILFLSKNSLLYCFFKDFLNVFALLSAYANIIIPIEQAIRLEMDNNKV